MPFNERETLRNDKYGDINKCEIDESGVHVELGKKGEALDEAITNQKQLYASLEEDQNSAE